MNTTTITTTLGHTKKIPSQFIEIVTRFIKIEKITKDIVTTILSTTITEKEYETLLKGEKHYFTFIKNNGEKSIIKKVKQLSKTYGSSSGIYIWTYLPTQQKYVGRAFDLSKRLSYYFYKSPVSYGKFIPLFRKSDLSNFTLEIQFVPRRKKGISNEIILEQYYLLHKEFNLNTIRISQGFKGLLNKSLYLYNRDLSICYFFSNKQIEFITILGINHTTFSKHLKNGTYYLGKYVFSHEIIEQAIYTDISINDICIMLQKDRIYNNRNKPISSFSKSVILLHNSSNKNYFCKSLGEAIRFLKEKGYKADQRTLVKRLNTSIPYYGYYCTIALVSRKKVIRFI